MTTRMVVLTLMLLAAVPAADARRARPGRPLRPARGARATRSRGAAAGVDEQTARDTRERLHEILEQYPPSVAQVLRLDPSLLTKADYLATYPTLAAYLAQHPEVAHNPVFFIGGAVGAGAYSDSRTQAMRAIEGVFEGLELLIGIMTGILTLAWLARAAIDHRRWLRATKIQVDAHTKIVDRLSSNEDLLAYMQSPTGQRFLSASLGVPAAGAAPTAVGAPFNRILWSVQAGIVMAAGGLGLWFAKNGVIDEVGQPMHVMAILAIDARRRLRRLRVRLLRALAPARAGAAARRPMREVTLSELERLGADAAVERGHVPRWTRTRSGCSTTARRGRSGPTCRAWRATRGSPTTCCRRRTTGSCAPTSPHESDAHRRNYLFRIAANLVKDLRRRPPMDQPPTGADGEQTDHRGPAIRRRRQRRGSTPRSGAVDGAA